MNNVKYILQKIRSQKQLSNQLIAANKLTDRYNLFVRPFFFIFFLSFTSSVFSIWRWVELCFFFFFHLHWVFEFVSISFRLFWWRWPFFFPLYNMVHEHGRECQCNCSVLIMPDKPHVFFYHRWLIWIIITWSHNIIQSCSCCPFECRWNCSWYVLVLFRIAAQFQRLSRCAQKYQNNYTEVTMCVQSIRE